MGVVMIENPALAFDSANQDAASITSALVLTLPCTAAVTKYTIVAITYSSSTAEVSVATATTTGGINGISLDTTTVAGQLCRVVVYGVAQVQGSASISAGAGFTPTTGGQAAAASTLGLNVGVMLANVTSSTTAFCWVGKY